MAIKPETVPCALNRFDCFYYCRKRCLVLNSKVTDQNCPFYATRATVYDNRARSYERLIELDLHELVEKYGSDKEYLNSFSSAQKGSYANQVYRKYRYLKNSGPGIKEKKTTAALEHQNTSDNRN